MAQYSEGRMAMFEPHSHLPYGEVGSGHYGEWHGKQTVECIAIVKDQIFAAVDSIPLTGDGGSQLFTIGDYGTADGAASIPLMRELIAQVRKKHGEIPIQIVYEDQPSNDFNSVFKRIHGLLPDPPTFLHDFSKVFVMASATGFYQQVMPDNQAHLILAFMAAHWLSGVPTKYHNSVYRFPEASKEEHEAVSRHAAKDWQTFLTLRAKELKAGGVLVVSVPSEDPEGRLEGMLCTTEDFPRLLTTTWRHMKDEGTITTEEFVNSNLNFCARYLSELKAPFEDPNSEVYRAGLRLISAEQVLVPCLARTHWLEQLEMEGVDDRRTWAKTVVSRHRCWSNSSFIRGLSSARSEGEKEALVDEMYRRMEDDMTSMDPRHFKNDFLLGYVFARKL